MPANASTMTTISKANSQFRADDLAGIRGTIITRSDPEYDAARAVHNGAVDRHPLAIVRCADVADVIACVAYARDNVLPLAIRGGDHHGGGFGVWDDALVIDLGGHRSTSVDPVAGTVRVDGGCVWGDVDHATGAFGMALPSGFISTTGVGGLTLGGGVGYLTRRLGLTIDNLISADVVLADGRFVIASAESHSDLFWALRGGGGNFVVVTSFTFRCHSIGEHGVIIGGPMLYDIADVEDLFRWYRACSRRCLMS
jgi:FAD/FMN-containing dehydrogenase